MTGAPRVGDYLGHILQAIERIQRYTRDMSKASFLGSELVQDAAIRNIEIIGEAARNVMREAPGFATLHSNIPWQVMYTMRNRVSHGYHQVDMDIVWNTIHRDLPHLYGLVKIIVDQHQYNVKDSGG
ncbi:DUF86 domain-containing protein [Limnobacter sp.]|uniref:HepT-like ribonuclease domain-containing protein n=1 Tax=Limnobacter sp. TaxID=2003368 RepID=UPI003511E268